MKVYYIGLWIKTDDPMYIRERILDLADTLNTEIDFTDPFEEKHTMPSEEYDDESIYYPPKVKE